VDAADASMEEDANDATHPVDSPVTADVADEPDASPCGAPWVLFTFVRIEEGGAEQTIQIYGERADGTDGHVLSLPIPQAENPSVSPDGTELLFTDQTLSELFLYRFSDGSYGQLRTAGGVGPGAVSPDGRLVAFGDGQNLFLIGVHGAMQRSLVMEEPKAAGSPVFARDSRTVVFSAEGVVQSVALDGSGLSTLITEEGNSFPDPTFSPDYTELAAIVSCGGSTALRAYPSGSLPAECASGRVIAVLPSGAPPYLAPSWGPTGLIAFSDAHDVFLVSASGGAPVRLTAELTTRHSYAAGPTWAPACAHVP
jgi:Tol biopolymer transport system component